MADIFVNQSLLTLKLDTTINISAATVKRILYTKPKSGGSGYWNATVVDNTFVSYDVQAGELDIDGLWKFQPYVEIAGKKGYGMVITQQVLKAIV